MTMSKTISRRRKLATSPHNPDGGKAREKPTARLREETGARPAGGACRHSPRRKLTDHIDLQAARDVRAALIHAIHLGLPLNRHVTINLAEAGAADPIWAIGRFLKLVRDAARRHGADIAYVWVRELGPQVGDHVHLLLHVPDLPGWFARRKPGWLKRCGLSPVLGASRTRVIRGSTRNATGELAHAELYAANLRTLERYVMKHCSRSVQMALGIKSWGPSAVVGKRLSISQNLHRAARSRCKLCRNSTSI